MPDSPAEHEDRCDALVLFGATGDLAHKKIFPAVYEMQKAGRLDVPVVGVASSSGDDDFIRGRAQTALEEYDPKLDESVWQRLRELISYVSGDYREPDVFKALATALQGRKRPLFYLAIPPVMFDAVIDGLRGVGLNEGARVVVEKPFGRDRASARELNDCLHRAFPEQPSSGSTTTSARNRSRTSSCSGSPTRCSSRSGTGTSSRTSRSR